MLEGACHPCGGTRLKAESRSVKVNHLRISDYCQLPLSDCLESLNQITLSPREELIAGPVLEEIRHRLEFIVNLGLGYLTLDRKAATISSGEAQRIRLATQVGSQLRGVLLCAG